MSGISFTEAINDTALVGEFPLLRILNKDQALWLDTIPGSPSFEDVKELPAGIFFNLYRDTLTFGPRGSEVTFFLDFAKKNFFRSEPAELVAAIDEFSDKIVAHEAVDLSDSTLRPAVTSIAQAVSDIATQKLGNNSRRMAPIIFWVALMIASQDNLAAAPQKRQRIVREVLAAMNRLVELSDVIRGNSCGQSLH